MNRLPTLPKDPIVSVYGTSFNHERFVAEAVESVLQQDWPGERVQFVFVDDGSTDRTREILAPYGDRVRLILQENRGVRGAVDRGMQELTGDLITSISGDDVWEPDRISRLVAAFRAHPRAGLVHSDVSVIDAQGALVAPSFRAATGVSGAGRPIRDVLLTHNVVPGTGIMFRGCLKDLVHPIPIDAAWEDYWWAWRIGQVADVVAIDDVTCRYRLHGDNLAFGASPEKTQAALRHERHFRRRMLQAIAPGQVSADAALCGLRVFRAACVGSAGQRLHGAPPPGPLLVSVQDRARSHARAKAARVSVGHNDVGGALVHAVAGLAADPGNEELSTWLREMETRWQPHLPTELVLRRRVVLADAQELADRPDLLESYCDAVSDLDDCTLVIHGPGWSDRRLVQTFMDALEHSDADVLATGDDPLGRDALIDRAHVVLGAAIDAPGLSRMLEDSPGLATMPDDRIEAGPHARTPA